MSADNYIGVVKIKEGCWTVEHGCMSLLQEDCQYSSGCVIGEYASREAALMAAHDVMKTEAIVEYGVIELYPQFEKPCGACLGCAERTR